MPRLSTSAILLRKIDFGDYDVIVTFFTISKGKMSAIAKSAKKSRRRFAGILELFSTLNIVCETGRRKGLPVLTEAVLIHPFPGIRSDILRTAYASYWAEMINECMEEGEKNQDIYKLYLYVLRALDGEFQPAAVLSVLFQLRFLLLSGYAPNLEECSKCHKNVEEISESKILFDLQKGGLLCRQCALRHPNQTELQKGTIKQLQWLKTGALKKAERSRFTDQAIGESLKLLEAFAPYHLGKRLRTLAFLQQIRGR
ncbi:MAG: DNA repair protein RecO [Deltaproteobacteria bacterium]|nr:DNA repair protein RecO [Deltaproteobacteria bacterium]MBW2151477.1 DNA repair protein RecO [Deltaproteobacteria bacterium]